MPKIKLHWDQKIQHSVVLDLRDDEMEAFLQDLKERSDVVLRNLCCSEKTEGESDCELMDFDLEDEAFS